MDSQQKAITNHKIPSSFAKKVRYYNVVCESCNGVHLAEQQHKGLAYQAGQ